MPKPYTGGCAVSGIDLDSLGDDDYHWPAEALIHVVPLDHDFCRRRSKSIAVGRICGPSHHEACNFCRLRKKSACEKVSERLAGRVNVVHQLRNFSMASVISTSPARGCTGDDSPVDLQAVGKCTVVPSLVA